MVIILDKKIMNESIINEVNAGRITLLYPNQDVREAFEFNNAVSYYSEHINTSELYRALNHEEYYFEIIIDNADVNEMYNLFLDDFLASHTYRDLYYKHHMSFSRLHSSSSKRFMAIRFKCITKYLKDMYLFIAKYLSDKGYDDVLLRVNSSCSLTFNSDLAYIMFCNIRYLSPRCVSQIVGTSEFKLELSY